MGSLYYDLVGILEGAGLRVSVGPINAGWERRARSSGGFSSPPLATFWHHTASKTSVDNDLSYMIDGCDDAPVGNLLLDRDGVYWPIAGGASNCAGKGRAMTFSRGTGAADNGNVWAFQIEVASNGVGEPFSVATIDALIAGSNALNAAVGNRPDDITSHALGAGDGYTDRKIDPATAAAVEGPWQPRSTNSSGTWSLADMRAEAINRAGRAPSPQPPVPLEASAMLTLFTIWDGANPTATYVSNGMTYRWLDTDAAIDALTTMMAVAGLPTERQQCDSSQIGWAGVYVDGHGQPVRNPYL